MKEILSNEQNTYVFLFNRFVSMFKTILSISSANNMVDNSSINILTRSAMELSLTLDYLLFATYIHNADSEDERKLKLHAYFLEGYLSKKKEFALLDEAGFRENKHYEGTIDEKILELRDKIESNPAYSLLSEAAKKSIGRKRFLTESESLSYIKMMKKVYKNEFIPIQYTYLSGYTHSGYESFLFQKHAEQIKDNRLLILYMSCASVFLTIRSYFKVDLDCFSEKENAIMLEFVAMGFTEAYNRIK
ncbi:DUF5677 domain-containing protein [Desulfovibrio sp. OttesenSCG-928-M14]|nr:DUF5677 domain-containing protein [Desulfovibrio sp. OttesenSCG-928-M14]